MDQICRNCKHWITENPVHGGEWMRAETNITYGARCKVIQRIVEIDISQGPWGNGGAEVDEVCTPPDFGCNKFEAI